MLTRMTGAMCIAAALLLMVMPAQSQDAPEAAVQNAHDFLETLTGLSDAVVTEQMLHTVMFGHSVGRATFTIEHGEHEGQACYVVTVAGDIRVGEYHTQTRSVAHILPNLQLLHSVYTETELDVLKVRQTYTRRDSAMDVELYDAEKDGDDRTRIFEFTPEPDVLLNGAEILAGMLLPKDTPRSYQFKTWSDNSERFHPVIIEIGESIEFRGGEAVKMIEHGINVTKDDLGNLEEEESETTYFINGIKLLRVETAGFTMDTEAPEAMTPISVADMDKRTAEYHPVLLFFRAVMEGSEDLLTKAINFDRFLDTLFKEDPDLREMDDDSKEMTRAFLRPALPGLMLEGAAENMQNQTEAERIRDGEMTKLLRFEEQFVVRTLENGSTAVRFRKEITDTMGKMEFIVEKSDDVWQVVWVIEGDDVEDLDEEEEATETKPGQKPSDDEEDF